MTTAFEELDRIRLSYLILADRAEVVNGKLYLMGGGWDRLALPNFDDPVVLSFALGITVPWHATNEEHRFGLAIVDDDSRPVDFHAEGAFTAGRPPHMLRGDTQIINLALPGIPVRLPKEGRYRLDATINGDHVGTLSFRAVAARPVITGRL